MMEQYLGLDDYVHLEKNVVYSEVSLPGPGSNPDDFNVQFAKGCDCDLGICISANMCQCIARYGPNYTSGGLLIEDKFNGPVLECNSECACYINVDRPNKDSLGAGPNRSRPRPSSGITAMGVGCVGLSRPTNGTHFPTQALDRPFETKVCNNRLVQKGPRKGLEIFVATNNKGFGLKSKFVIPKGSFICEYAGEVIGLDEAKLRSVVNADKMNYIFVLREHVGESKIIKTCVDPTTIGNVGRYINHSCQPNSAVVPVRVDNPVPKLAIFSISDIKVGEEITFDYGDGHGSRLDSKPRDARICLCGAPKCRIFLPFEEELF